jgi:hypothetical protein
MEYCKQVSMLLNERALSGGVLPDEVEDEHLDKLDVLWYQLSAEEVAEVEAYLAQVPEGSPTNAEDCPVEIGQSTPPRTQKDA